MLKNHFLCSSGEKQMKLAEQQQKELELKKQHAQMRQTPLHLAAPYMMSHGNYRSLHQTRSPMDPAPPATGYHPGFPYNQYAPQEYEHFAPVETAYKEASNEYHQPGQFQQHSSVFQFQHPTTGAMSTAQGQYSQSYFMYQPSLIEPCHDLPCGQQGH